MKNYLYQVQQRAIEAFWTSVSNDLPLSTGDIGPMDQNSFEEEAERMVNLYVENVDRPPIPDVLKRSKIILKEKECVHCCAPDVWEVGPGVLKCSTCRRVQ